MKCKAIQATEGGQFVSPCQPYAMTPQKRQLFIGRWSNDVQTNRHKYDKILGCRIVIPVYIERLSCVKKKTSSVQKNCVMTAYVHLPACAHERMC